MSSCDASRGRSSAGAAMADAARSARLNHSAIRCSAATHHRRTDARRIEEEWRARFAVFRHGVLMEHGKAGRKERISARGIDADVARVGRLDGKPGRIVECAAIDAADIREPLESDIKLCRTSRTGVDMKTLATALGVWV